VTIVILGAWFWWTAYRRRVVEKREEELDKDRKGDTNTELGHNATSQTVEPRCSPKVVSKVSEIVNGADMV
jgi:hypothetical protein